MSTDNVLSVGLNVTFCGITIVFIALILLVFIISLFSFMFKKDKKKSDLPAKTTSYVAPLKQNTDDGDGELIAVIAAAVDAIYDGTGKKAVIRSIKPAKISRRSAWASAGLAENTRTF